MRQHTASASRSNLVKFLNDPWSQGVLTGALTLIPPRNYPQWIRQTLIWGTPVAGGVGAAYLANNPRLRRKLSAKAALAQHADPSTRTSLRPQEPPVNFLAKNYRSTASMVLIGTALGAAASLGTVAGFWVDEKIEQGLRRLNVPLPRVVMAATAGAVTWWTLKQDQDRNS
jgi:hypothetical protein